MLGFDTVQAFVLGMLDDAELHLDAMVITGLTASEMTRRSPTSVSFYGTMNKRFELLKSIPLCRYSNMTWFGTRPGYVDDQVRQFTEEHRENGPMSRQTWLQRFGP